MRHDHEEADTLLILQAHDIAQADHFTDCVVYSPDTDVFLLILHYSQDLPQALKFWTGKGINYRDVDVNACFENLGPSHCKSLLAFHVFTGCDQTRRFCGKSKTTWWNHFITTDNDTLDAFSRLGIADAFYHLLGY